MKKCKACNEDKPEADFPRDNQKRDGLHTYCKSCKSAVECSKRAVRRHRKEGADILLCVICRRNISGLEAFHYNQHKRSHICLLCYDGYGDHIRSLAPEISEYEKMSSAEKRAWHSTTSILRAKVEIVLYLGGKCAHCHARPGDTWPLRCFECHHLDPEGKELEIGQMAANGIRKNFSAVLSELDKCILLCANCHRREHWRLLKEQRYGGKRGVDVLGG